MRYTLLVLGVVLVVVASVIADDDDDNAPTTIESYNFSWLVSESDGNKLQVTKSDGVVAVTLSDAKSRAIVRMTPSQAAKVAAAMLDDKTRDKRVDNGDVSVKHETMSDGADVTVIKRDKSYSQPLALKRRACRELALRMRHAERLAKMVDESVVPRTSR